MQMILGIIVVLALIGGGMWLWEKIQDLFFGATESIAMFLDGSSRSRSKEKGRSQAQPSLKPLPDPCDAHDILEAFCRVMHGIDVKLNSLCYSDGTGMLSGGIDQSGKGWVHFWYDKDYSGVSTALHELGYYLPGERKGLSAASDSNAGWSDDGSGMISYRSNSVTGYYEWTGYNTLYKQFGKSAAEESMRRMIEAVLQNEWPEARITSYSGGFERPDGSPVAYMIQIRTVANE